MSERFAWIFDKEKQKKIWCADMWSRKNILALKQKFAVVTGVTPSNTSFSTNYPYPTGFNFNNCVLLSLEINVTDAWYYAGDGVVAMDGRLYAKLSSNGVAVRQSQSSAYDVPFRVTLMRTDI